MKKLIRSAIGKECKRFFKDWPFKFYYHHSPGRKYPFLLSFMGLNLEILDKFIRDFNKFLDFVKEASDYILKEVDIKVEKKEITNFNFEFWKEELEEDRKNPLDPFLDSFKDFLSLPFDKTWFITLKCWKYHYSISYYSSERGYYVYQWDSRVRVANYLTPLVLSFICMEGNKGLKFNNEEIERLDKILEGKSIEEIYTYLKLLKGLE